MNNDRLFAPNFATMAKPRNRFPALTEAERAAILARRTVTRCPPTAVPLPHQQLCKGRYL